MATGVARLILRNVAILVISGCRAPQLSGAQAAAVEQPEGTKQAVEETSAEATSPVQEASDRPSLLRVILVEVLVAPVKSDGRPWDMGDADSGAALRVIDQVASIAASSGEPVAAAVKLATASIPVLSKGKAWPDVQGQAQMSPVPTGSGKANVVAHAPDDPLAQVSDPDGQELSWIVQTSKRPRLRVSLIDRDTMNDDAIGVFVIDDDEMENAWRDGGKYWVRVTDQTNNQVLAVGIIVEEVE